MRKGKIGKAQDECGQYHAPVIEAPPHSESNCEEDVGKEREDRKKSPHLIPLPHPLDEARPLPGE
jgi:hypothetical protein